MAGHAQLKLVVTECSKTQIRLTRLNYILLFRNKVTREMIQIAVEHELLFIGYKIQTQPGEKIEDLT